MRRSVREQLGPVMHESGIKVGGRVYAHPDHIREFLKENPCRKCARPKGLCETPCAVRKYWGKQRERGSSA